MGGHGGLNILPQKKWNVYNWDNRLKVQKDKRIAQEKKEQQERVEHMQQARGRIQQLKKTKGNYSHTPSPSNSSREKQQQEKQTVTSKINDDLKKIAKEKKNINLFEKEEEQMIRKENTQAYIEMEKEFFKDKPFDLSSKFLGQFSDANQPWYLKSNATADKEGQIKVREQIDQFRKQTNQFYQVLKLKENEAKEPQDELVKNEEQIKQEELNRTAKQLKQEAKEKKEELKKQEKLQKLALELKAMLGHDSESEEEKEAARKQREKEKQQLRKERIQREKSEKQKVCKLMSQKYGFKYD